MTRFVMAALALVASLFGALRAEPLTVTCPEGREVLCRLLDDLDVCGQPQVVGGCGGTSVLYRDSVLAVDSLVIRIWSVADTCGETQVCFQPLTLLPGRPRLAVLPLENLSTAEEGARVFQRLLEEALADLEPAEFIAPAKVDDAVMRGRVRQPVLMDDEQRERLSRGLDAQYLVVGSLLNYEIYQDQYSGPIPMISCVLQLQRASDGRTLWSESLHAVGNDGEWLFGLGVEHDITRLGRNLARKVARALADHIADAPCAPRAD